MLTSCKYCGETNLRWEEWPQGWRLVEGERSVAHHCAEGRAAVQNAKYTPQYPELPRRTRNTKSGAFLRCYGPRGARTHAVLVQTKTPDPDTPVGMYAALEEEPRKPAFYSKANP